MEKTLPATLLHPQENEEEKGIKKQLYDTTGISALEHHRQRFILSLLYESQLCSAQRKK